MKKMKEPITVVGWETEATGLWTGSTRTLAEGNERRLLRIIAVGGKKKAIAESARWPNSSGMMGKRGATNEDR